jgi:hypothetical protein
LEAPENKKLKKRVWPGGAFLAYHSPIIPPPLHHIVKIRAALRAVPVQRCTAVTKHSEAVPIRLWHHASPVSHPIPTRLPKLLHDPPSRTTSKRPRASSWTPTNTWPKRYSIIRNRIKRLREWQISVDNTAQTCIIDSIVVIH